MMTTCGPVDRPPGGAPPPPEDEKEVVTEGDGGPSPVAAGAGAESGDLAPLLAEAQAKAAENWDLFLRTRADLDNYRRRAERDLALMIRRGKGDLVTRLLEVLDALDRAVTWESGDQAGLGLIHRLFLKALATEGIRPIECLGQPFDPARHEAIDVRTDPTAAGPTVTGELQRGYTYDNEVLRAARVQVTQPPG
jgi:molecular chaperone GrpE